MDGIRNRYKERKELIDYVEEIIREVVEKGDQALIELTARFDGVNLTPGEIEVSKDEWDKKASETDPEITDILIQSADNIKNYSEKQNI